MTLLIESEALAVIPSTVKAVFQKYPSLTSEATKFVHKPPLRVDDPCRTLYVSQKEYAIVSQRDPHLSVVGSDDATTCHIVILHNRKSELFSMAHIDSASNIEALTRIVADTIGDSEMDDNLTLNLYVIGGYTDERCTSELLTLELLHFYRELPVIFKLCLFCVGEVNTQLKNGVNWPIIYGASVSFDTEFFNVHSANFALSTRGPCVPLRSSRFLGNLDTVYRIYHSKEGTLTIQPFKYAFHPKMLEWLQKSDEFILANFSSSPAVEPPHFSQQMKNVFQFIIKNPHPLSTVFKASQSLNFSLSTDGTWEPV